MIAGSIIQALPTTTTVVSGYLSLQLIALLHSQDITKENSKCKFRLIF